MISYALSMIPPWREALAHALDVVAPGGSLQIVDFGDCAGLPRPFKAGLRRWLAMFDVTPRDDLAAALEALAAERGMSCGDREPVSRLRDPGGRAAKRIAEPACAGGAPALAGIFTGAPQGFQRFTTPFTGGLKIGCVSWMK